MWLRGGWSFDDMIREVVAAGLKRYGIK